jgi:hypothetical protein
VHAIVRTLAFGVEHQLLDGYYRQVSNTPGGGFLGMDGHVSIEIACQLPVLAVAPNAPA